MERFPSFRAAEDDKGVARISLDFEISAEWEDSATNAAVGSRLKVGTSYSIISIEGELSRSIAEHPSLDVMGEVEIGVKFRDKRWGAEVLGVEKTKLVDDEPTGKGGGVILWGGVLTGGTGTSGELTGSREDGGKRVGTAFLFNLMRSLVWNWVVQKCNLHICTRACSP